jgi:hypothetical protein
VVRIGALNTPETASIKVQDYVQANVWLQAAIYKENQDKTAQPSKAS